MAGGLIQKEVLYQWAWQAKTKYAKEGCEV